MAYLLRLLGCCAFVLAVVPALVADLSRPERVWEPHDIDLRAAGAHAWWDLPVRAEFVHQETGARISLEGFWNGGDRWCVRFAAPRSGTWTFRTTSADAGLDGQAGSFVVRDVTADELRQNANLRGGIRVRPGERHFSHADGTPFFLLADTVWAANTARCGLGEADDGPFFTYLADRRAKGFTAVLLQYFHGYGDYPEAAGHRNEGGKIFPDDDPARLNPEFFAALDRRMQAIWSHGLVAAIPTTWWGKTRRRWITAEEARRVAVYCGLRYGAFNALWSLSGEYQYAFKDLGWTPADFEELGNALQRHNPYRRPLSIHPSSRTDFAPPHDAQSSHAFHGSPWLDHHWLQTGQRLTDLPNLVSRLAQNRALAPAMPVFASEASYERASDPESAYHARWQAWTALLNGAAGYGYGAMGLWQFFDPDDARGETGKRTADAVPWSQALAFPGAAQVGHVRQIMSRLSWWNLQPARTELALDGERNPAPTAADLSPPHAARSATDAVIYVPRGNATRRLSFASQGSAWRARWFDPRTGTSLSSEQRLLSSGQAQVELPARPRPQHEDWVLVLERAD